MLYLDRDDQANIRKPLKEQRLNEIRNTRIESVVSGELPFLLEVIYSSQDSFYIKVINGKEEIVVKDIRFGRSFKTAKDTIEIRFPEYNSMLKAVVEDRVMSGEFIDFSRPGDYRIPFTAQQGKNYRFTELHKEPSVNVTGDWTVNFGVDSSDMFTGEAQFKLQEKNHLLATIATETGDFRYLEGTVQDNKLYFSTFDGAHAFLFEGKIESKDSIQGIFQSGKHYQTYWTARPGKMDLSDPFSIIPVDKNYSIKLKSWLKDSFGITSNRIKNGVPTVIEIMGTWCPNCKDAALLLKESHHQYPGVQKIALAFERKGLKNIDEHLHAYHEALDLPYDMYYAGLADRKMAARKTPFVEELFSFPSLLFIDSSGRIIASYSGFYGPATSQYSGQKDKIMSFLAHLSK